MRKKFIKGPIPLDWMDAVLLMGGRALNVALAIWYQVGLKKTKTVTLPRSTSKLFRVTRHNVWRVLKRLEEERLIYVVRQKGKLSRITILDFQVEKIKQDWDA
jgi:hypothetical protein